MKKNLFYKLCIFSIITLFTACTEIIDININASNPQFVVEATLGVNKNSLVLISKTDDLNGKNNFKQIEGAIVSISDDNGNKAILNEISPGTYTNAILNGKIGETYNLNVQVEDKTITSSCKIPELVPIDSMTIVNSIYPGGGPPTGNQPAPFYEINVHFTDPVSTTNYYRFLIYINDIAQSGNRVYNDIFNNGKNIKQTLFIFNNSLKSGDKLSIEMQCIDKSVFNYFQSMGNSSMGGGGNASSPANPYTNLKGANLGYFSAHTVQRRDYIIP